MKVQHKRSGNIAEVISNDGKRVVVKDVVKNEATELAISTYKRWWKKIDDEPDEQTKKAIEVVKEMPAEKVVETVEKVIKKEKAKKALIDDNKCGDGTPLAEVGKEILEQAKKKAQQAKKQKDIKATKKEPAKKKKTDAPTKPKIDAIDVVEKICNDNGWKYSRKGKFLRVFNSDNKNIAPIYRRPAAVRIYVADVKQFDKKLLIKSDSEPYGKKFSGSIFVAVENIDKVLEIIVKNSKKEEK